MRTIPLLLLIVLLSGTAFVSAQTKQSFGSVTVTGKTVKAADGKKSALPRKRFYIFSGGLKDNEALVARIKAAEITSRDCYYTQLKASACFISWLQKENCESPFCRKVERNDVQGVQEFEDAYNKGLTRYNKRPDLALSWIIDSLPSDLMNGFYRSRKAKIEEILGGQKPVGDTMTSGTEVAAKFVDVPTTDKPTKFIISNVIPIEIGAKSYVWVCEVSVQTDKVTPLPLSLDPKSKCAPTPRDLQVCNTGTCDKK